MGSHQVVIAVGMTIVLQERLYRVESCLKVTVSKGQPFIKSKLRDLATNELVEKNFKPNQTVEEVQLQERNLEFLYPEGESFLFLDIDLLDKLLIPKEVIGQRANYLKEGIEVKAQCYGQLVYAVELPQFLELMVVKTDEPSDQGALTNATKSALLETGARVEVPLFIAVGDVVKVDTRTDEYIQRV